MTTPLISRPKGELLELYAKLMLARMSEEQISKEYFKDEMKTPVHLGIGGEAIPVGIQHAAPKNTVHFATYRNHAIYLAQTDDVDGFFGEMYGKSNGCAKGKAGSMHMSNPEKGLIATSAVVGTTIPVAAGAALAYKYKKDPRMVVTFFGDGAIEEGAFWETLNFACLHKLNILFVCEDNDLAIHSFRRDREGFQSIDKVAAAFKLAFGSGDGTDITNVVDTADRVMSQMKSQGGPGFLHLHYYRFLEHVGPLEDFKFGYRPKAEAAAERFDPVRKFEAALKSAGIAQADLDAVRNRLAGRIESAVAKAKAAPFPDASELFTDIFANGESPDPVRLGRLGGSSAQGRTSIPSSHQPSRHL